MSLRSQPHRSPIRGLRARAGQLGIGNTVDRSSPSARSSEQTWSQLSLGLNDTCGIDSSGFLYCWGANAFGQLGIGNTDDQHVPVRVEE